jgi:DNA polymerase eta
VEKMANHARVILHIDLDCFYCQVEQKRLDISPDVPCAVQQWEGLIAINYAARERGVTRHMRVREAKQRCPEIRLVHVKTLGGPADGNQNDLDTEASGKDRLTRKASLERYRRASAEILAVLHDVAPQVQLHNLWICSLQICHSDMSGSHVS